MCILGGKTILLPPEQKRKKELVWRGPTPEWDDLDLLLQDNNNGRTRAGIYLHIFILLVYNLLVELSRIIYMSATSVLDSVTSSQSVFFVEPIVDQ